MPSPRGVATYDRKPEMSAYRVTEKAVEALSIGSYALIVMNYANADMVGHSGNMQATMKAVEVVSDCLSRVIPAALAKGTVALVTADHGNADKMVDGDGKPHTSHTTNPVPFIVIGEDGSVSLRREGKLADIAPTILRIMGMPVPKEMDGKPLILEEPSGSQTSSRFLTR